MIISILWLSLWNQLFQEHVSSYAATYGKTEQWFQQKIDQDSYENITLICSWFLFFISYTKNIFKDTYVILSFNYHTLLPDKVKNSHWSPNVFLENPSYMHPKTIHLHLSHFSNFWAPPSEFGFKFIRELPTRWPFFGKKSTMLP